MSDTLQRLQDQRALHPMAEHTKMYGNILTMITAAISAKEWDSELFKKLTDAIFAYGRSRMDYGFWDGAIAAHIGWIETTLERVEAEQYAEAAAKSGQAELALPPDPDDPRGLADHLDDLSSGRDPSPVESAGTG
jgi:hypothetical protein